MSITGRERRMSRLIDSSTERTLIVPVDDSLIAGPVNGLDDLDAKLTTIADARPNAILGFAGQFENCGAMPLDLGWICNLTASTVRSTHTRKVMTGSVRGALSLGADAVAAHVNITSGFEGEMLRMLAKIIGEARPLGVPVVAIMYPRRERSDGTDDNYDDLREGDEEQFAMLVAHAARVGRDLGASLIKTQFTGSTASFERVVKSARPVPVVIAGGPLKSIEDALTMAHAAIAAGGAGVSLGRNVYGREDPGLMIRALRQIVHSEASVPDALRIAGCERDV